MNEVIKKTSNYWSNILSLKFRKLTGWKSEKEFESLYITKEEFLERAAISEVEPAAKVSRRDAAKMLRKLSNYD